VHRKREVNARGLKTEQVIVSKRKNSPYRSGRSPDWLKMKNMDAPAVRREAEEDWGKGR
jgi:ATP-dependent DNA ligase